MFISKFSDAIKHELQQCKTEEEIKSVTSKMSSKDRERFEQCFYCELLKTCKRLEESENEEGLCKFFKELPEETIKAFSEALQGALKSVEENEHN